MSTTKVKKRTTSSSKKGIKQTIKKASSIVKLTILFIIGLGLMVFSISKYFSADAFGTGVGTAAAKAAGKLTGSYDGITEGIAEGAKEGKAEGLSAKDTEVDIANKVQTMGKLEVLSASVVMHDLLEISDKYKTLLAFYGDITFTVDLYNSEITSSGNIYEVVLPLPEATLRIDDKKSEQLDSYMKHSWSGSNEDGYTAVMNSIKELTLNSEKTVSNYDSLKEAAKSSAEKQVTFLIQSSTKEEVVIHVRFKENNT